jgi:hypothetical protein
VSPVANVCEWLRNLHNLRPESRALMQNGIVTAFWKRPRRRSPGRVWMPAWTISPNRPVWGLELCIATSHRAMNFWKRFIGLK